MLTLGACSVIERQRLDGEFGPADERRYDQPALPGAQVPAYREVQSILDRRCVVCHACYDASCQLKLGAWEGVARGGSKLRVYDGARLLAQAPTRLFEDAERASAWRQMGFHPVLNERENTPRANLEGSVLARMLRLKETGPLPAGPVLPASFDFSLDREQVCPRIEEFDRYAQAHPLAGMPYGLPGLSQQEQETLLRWVAAGAPGGPEPGLPMALARQVAEWEALLNGEGLRDQLSARYIYEHLFLAHLHFGDTPVFFKLVRSRTPPGSPVDLIASRRPYDDPGVARTYYRLVPERETIVSKTHMPYRLDGARLALWRKLFFGADFPVEHLPGYAPDLAANPFRTFEAIPVRARYRFLLDEASFTVMGFIKGPVCRGQLAVDVINDHFWVFFLDPEVLGETEESRFLARNSDELRLPGEMGSTAPLLLHWGTYADGQLRYLAAKREFVAQLAARVPRSGAALVWNGDGRNDNAALTIFRNFDNATVVKGLVGEHPQTAWVISYPLLERFHYLLVAGFDVFGNMGHQLDTRLYMDFLRIEGEQNFLSLLPESAQQALQARWYRNAPERVGTFLAASHLDRGQRVEPGLEALPPDAAAATLLERIRQRLGGAIAGQYSLDRVQDPLLRRDLQALAAIRGESLRWLPQVTVLRVRGKDGAHLWFTLLNNTAYTNVAQLFDADERRLPGEDSLTLVHGHLGAYPNAFWDVPAGELGELAGRIRNLASEADYARLLDRHGVRRTHADFWAFSDLAHGDMRRALGVEFGLYDYNRLENR